MRAAVDQNTWVSAVLNPAGLPARLARALADGQFEAVGWEGFSEELFEVLQRPRLTRRHGKPPATVRDFVETLSDLTAQVPVSGEVRVCRDSDDDALIEAALKGGASAIVTGDNDLLADPAVEAFLRPFQVEVLNVRQFLERLASEGARSRSI